MAAKENKISIAVLPFKNQSDDRSKNYFCEGISEEVINALSTIKELKVTSRSSSFIFRDQAISSREIGEKLNVQILLEGSVRIDEDRIRISAQLIDVKEDTYFWADKWDRKLLNLFDIQDEISIEIANRIRENVGHFNISDHLIDHPTENLKAYDHYLKGKFHFNQWNPEDVKKGIDEFQNALKIDDQMIEAHLGLADAYSFMAVAGFAPREESWARSTEALEKAKKIDPEDAGLNYQLGNQSFFTRADYASAIDHFKRSIQKRPTYADPHRFISFLHCLSADFVKAHEHLLYCLSIDPLNPESKFFKANLLYRKKEYDQAYAIVNELLEDNPLSLPAIIIKTYVLLKKRKFDEALQTIENTPEGLLTPDERLGLLALIDALQQKTQSPQIIELEKHALSSEAHHAHSYLFMIYANLGENEKAFKLLDQLFENDSSILLLGFSDPLSEAIQSDQRYQEFQNRIYPKPKVRKTVQLKESKKAPLDDTQVEQIKKELEIRMEEEQVFLNPSLSLALLASQLDLSSNQLSWLLNESLGKNFNEYINRARIEYFKELLLDPKNSHISIIGLAYESGFNSKTVFNTNFKKFEGTTPKEYQKLHQ